AVVVPDRGERRGVGRERHGRQPRAVDEVAPRELAREVLRIGGAAAVAAKEDRAAVLEAPEDQLCRRCDGGGTRLLESRDRARGLLERGTCLALERSPAGTAPGAG